MYFYQKIKGTFWYRNSTDNRECKVPIKTDDDPDI